MALLLLRIAIGLTGIMQGSVIVAGLGSSASVAWVTALVLVLSGLLLVIGFATPIVSAAEALAVIAICCSERAVPSAWFITGPVAICLFLAVAAALVLLGPGSLSLDSRLFGRREIIIPRKRQSRAESR